MLCLFMFFCACKKSGKLVTKGAFLDGVGCKIADVALLASKN